jgi:hypothetical protein
LRTSRQRQWRGILGPSGRFLCRGGGRDRQLTRGMQVLGVFGAHAEGTQECVRRGHPSSARTGAKGEEKEQGMRRLLNGSRSVSLSCQTRRALGGRFRGYTVSPNSLPTLLPSLVICISFSSPSTPLVSLPLPPPTLSVLPSFYIPIPATVYSKEHFTLFQLSPSTRTSQGPPLPPSHPAAASTS